MKIFIKNKIPIIESHSVMSFVSKIYGFSCGAMAIFPFIFVRDSKIIENKEYINHEMIHIRQYMETLILGLIVSSFFEYIYARFVLKKSKIQSYYFMSHEQEAHQNDQNLDYLKNRPLFSYFKYMKLNNKKNFDLVSGKRVLLD